MMEEVRVYDDPDALSRAAATYLQERIAALLAGQASVSLVLAGGSTPRRLYENFAAEMPLPWERIHLFLGDERFVPADDPESNFGMIRKTLLQHIFIPNEHLHFYDTDLATPEDCARAYESTVNEFFQGAPRFDVVLLGMGADGHTLSIFPEGDEADASRLVAATEAPASYTTQQRVTLSMSAVNQADEAIFLIAGADKSNAFSIARPDSPRRDSLPAGKVRPRHRLLWFVDAEAAR